VPKLLAAAFHEAVSVQRLAELFRSDWNQLFAGTTVGHCPKCRQQFAVFFSSSDDPKNLDYLKQMGQSGRVTEIRSWLAKRLTASADIFAKRFEQEMKAGRLARTPSAKVRARALVDLLQGLQLRAKAGIAREQLLQDARSYVPLILGKQI
jgi:hypothetical protein